MIDKVTEKAHDFALFLSEHLYHEITTRMNLIRATSRKIWNKRWKERTKRVQYCKLISKVNHRHLNIHAERSKMHNALIIQLKINKIQFNKLLHERRVFNVLTTHCLCNEKHIIIKHVLLFCSNWRKKRKNVIKNEDHEYKITIQRTQSDDDRNMNNINNRSAESVSDDEIIEKEKNFSNEEFSNTRQQKENKSEIDVANSASRRRN